MKNFGEYKLPENWSWSSLPEIIGDDGVFCDGDWVESKDQDPNGDVRLIQLADIGDGTYRDKSSRFLTRGKAEELRCTFIKPGDVLIARMPEPLGRSCVFPGDEKEAVTVVDVCIVRPNKTKINNKWLSHIVNALPFRTVIESRQSGSTRKRISRKNLSTIPMPVPPLPEQHRIVEEIEKQFTRLDAGVAALKSIQTKLKRYRASVLKAACEGKLVPTEAELAKKEGRTYETGEELLKRILIERKKAFEEQQKKTGKNKKYVEPKVPDTTDLPELSEGWTWGIIEQISSLITKGSSPRWQGFEYAEEGIVFIRSENVRWGYLDLSTISRLPYKFNEKENKSILLNGDVLLNIVGASIGRAAIAGPEIENGNVNQAVAVIRLIEKTILNRYSLIWILSYNAQKQINLRKVDVARANFSLEEIKNLPIPLPSLAEQKLIVDEVERRLSVVEELETLVDANLKRAERLRQAILKKAFEGELVK